jgi:L-alanine-DL-glutamate epimerase-like enolase superfamily enzyme
MRIRSVQAHLLSYVFPQPVELTYFGGTRQIVKRDAMLIRVEADNGLVGYGPGEASESAARLIMETIKPWLEGRVLADADALRVQFHQAAKPDLRTSHTYGTLEVALYDLLGKAAGLPVSELLGGRIRDRIKCYGSSGMYQSPEGYAAEAKLAQEMGFPAYKMRPAAGPDEDVAAVRAMREATGAGFGLMVDAHAWWRMGDRSYSAATVEKVAERMSQYELTWLEEPLPPADHAAYRKLRETGLTPVASGEHEPSEDSFLDLIEGGCADYIQMDVVCQGGYAQSRRIFDAVEREGLRFAFHSWGSELELAAAAQLGVCWPEQVVEWLEYPLYSEPGRKFMYEFPLAMEMLREPLVVEAGELIAPRGPGLGVTVNERVLEKYPWVSGPWSYFTLISPPGRFAVTGDHANTGLGQ